MASFCIAFDDSGGVEPLCDWKGEVIAGDHPITVLTGVYIRQDLIEEFDTRWNDLRFRIGQRLNCDPPPIHLRLMWGKSLPRTYRRSSNPYLWAGFEETKAWVREAVGIFREFVGRRAMGAIMRRSIRRQAATVQSNYLRDPRFQAELAFIRKRTG